MSLCYLGFNNYIHPAINSALLLLQYFGFTFSHLTYSRLQVHIITIFWLQITSSFNILATFIQQSTLHCYKGYFWLQYIGFKLHLTTIFWLHIQPPHQLLTTSQLQVHIITIFWLQNTCDYNILASHSATSPTLDYKYTL